MKLNMLVSRKNDVMQNMLWSLRHVNARKSYLHFYRVTGNAIKIIIIFVVVVFKLIISFIKIELLCLDR